MESETIFVRMLNDQGQVRDSYTDYWHLVKLCGYKVCALGEIDFASDNVYIYSPDDGNSRATFATDAAKNRRCKVVLWQLEWPLWKAGSLVGCDVPTYVDEMWVSDRYYLALQMQFNTAQARKVKHVFLGGHPKIGGEPMLSPTWDLCPLMYSYGTREHKIQILKSHGLTVAPNAWGQDRDFILRSSRWGLHLHQFPMPFIAPQRFLLFASYGLPILCDYCADPYPYKVFQDALIHFDPRETSVMNDQLRNGAVEFNYTLVRETMPFRDQVDDAVSQLQQKEMQDVD